MRGLLYFKMTDCSCFSRFSFLFTDFSLAAAESFFFFVLSCCVYTHSIHSFIHSFIYPFFAYIAYTFITSSGKMSLILFAVLQLSFIVRNVISTCSTTSDLEFTFYGFPDGPSDTTSFGCSGTTQVADGTAGGSSPHPLKSIHISLLTAPPSR